MKIIKSIGEMKPFLAGARKNGLSVGLVPTMGCFHEGHISLIHRAVTENDVSIVSVFVNPTQFGPNEDYKQYPRDLENDSSTASQVGADVLFAPPVEEIYHKGYQTYVNVTKLTKGMCGASRPGHFAGVATIVLKLFNIVQPDRAYFGEKDYQQLMVIRRMAEDLNVPVEIVGMPIFRDTDGVAVSSRNTYLSIDERKAAMVLNKSLLLAKKLVAEGMTNSESLRGRIEEFIRGEPLAKIDYVAIVNPKTLEPVLDVCDDTLLALAVYIGKTRLIDNSLINRRGLNGNQVL